ncbi:MAG: hypothetical protein R3B11_14245 [Nitrospira sp.]|jgi:hypothetical protein|nr:hypothetical protein [Nitrospira sp.]MDR4477146.1 hypothetical protein [Nitrospira sp.]HAP39356.1 hypothetical protein [Nitrospira sp.]
MVRRTAVRRLVLICLAAVGLWMLLIVQSHAGTIVVDLSVEQGPMHHRANGYLVSIEPTEPATSLIAPLKPTSFRGNAGYVLSNYDRLTQVGVKEFQLTLGLVFHHLALQIFDINQIGLDGNYAPWLAHVDRVIDQVLERRLQVLWDIYNEPDLAALPLNENARLKEGWRLAYRRIKERIPGAQVVGPSVSRYRLLQPFLEWSQSQDVFPDVVAYHEYGDPSGALGYVDDLRNYLYAHGLTRPISVNEILGQESWTIAGYTAGVIAAYERADILSAMRACWPDPQDMSRGSVENTCDNPTLDGLLYVDRRSKRPGWHIYHTYAEMRGVRVSTITDSPTLHALAALEKPAGTLRLLLGKYEDSSAEDTRVVIRSTRGRVWSAQNEQLYVCAERIPDVGSAPLETPVVTLNHALPISESEISFILPDFYHSDAYRLVLGPSTSCPKPR